MSFSPVIDALALPTDSRVDQRVPKKLMLEQGAPTPADKRYIQDGIEELIWIAALKPTNIGVPVFRDEVREYLEITVLTCTLREAAKPNRLIELIHRAIPYPTILVSDYNKATTFSLAHKRWSQGEKGKVVIEDLRCSAPINPDAPSTEESSFLTSLALSKLPTLDMFSLYQAWLDCIAVLEAAKITGTFVSPASADRAAHLRDSLDEHARLQREIAVLRSQAEKERQLNRRVQLNLEIKRLESELAATEQTL